MQSSQARALAAPLDVDADAVSAEAKPALFEALVADDQAAAGSPARALQNELLSRLSQDETEAKWSPRKTMLFLVGTCGSFWAVVGWCAYSLLHR